MRESIRPTLKVNHVAKYVEENPNKVVQLIRVDDDYDPNGINKEHYENRGWEVCMGNVEVADDRANTPNSKESRVKHPIMKNGRGKAVFLAMSIDKEELTKNEQERAKANLEKFIASSTGRKAVKHGKELKITDSEVNETNMNRSGE